MRELLVGDAVVELGHRARSDELAETPERTALLGNGHREKSLALLAEFGALGNEAQAVEIHIRATGDGDQRAPLQLVRFHVLLDGSHAQGAGRLQDAARVLEDVLDGGAHGVGVHHDEIVDQRPRDAKGLLAHQLDRGAVGEQSHVGQLHAPAPAHRLQHGIGIGGLHADDADLGPQRLDIGRHAGDQPAAADGHEDGVDRPLVLAQDLHRHRALAGDHVGVVEGMHEAQSLRLLQFQRVRMGVAVAVAVQHDLAAQRMHGVDLQLRCRHRHHDDGAAAQLLRRQRHALRVVAGRGADDAARQRLGVQVRHLVVRAAQLEAENRLLVFALEQHVVADAARQRARRLECGFTRHVVDAGGEDALQVAGGDALRLGVGLRHGGRCGIGIGRGRRRRGRAGGACGHRAASEGIWKAAHDKSAPAGGRGRRRAKKKARSLGRPRAESTIEGGGGDNLRVT